MAYDRFMNLEKMNRKHLAACFAVLSAGLFTSPAEVWSLQNEKITDFQMVIQKSHTSWIQSVSYSPDGKYIVSGGGDFTIKLWNREGILLRTFAEQSGWVMSVSFSPDGKHIISGLADNKIKLWDIEGNLIKILEGHSYIVKSVAFSPDGKYIVSGSGDNTIKLWTIDGRLLKTFKGHSGEVTSVSFSPYGRYIISGSADKTIKLWDIEGKLIRTFEGHSAGVLSVAFSPDGKHIASGSSDKTLNLWSIDGRLDRTFTGYSDPILSVSFSPDGEYIASGAHKVIKLWNINGELIRTFDGWPGQVECVSFSPDGKFVVAGSWNTAITIWNIEKGFTKYLYQPLDPVTAVSFSPDGKLIVSGNTQNTLKLWSTEGKLIKTLKGHSGWVSSVAFSPDGKYIASGSGDQTIKLWDIEGNPVRTFEGHSADVASVSFSTDGKYLVSGARDNTIKLWDLEGKLIKTFEGHAKQVNRVSFGPDGKHIASSSFDGTVKLWDVDGNLIRTFEGHPGWVGQAAFSPDGKNLAFGSSEKTIHFWDMEGNLTRTIDGFSGIVTHVLFSPDGRYIIARTDDNTIMIRNMEGKLVKTFTAAPSNMAFSPDSKYLAAGFIDGTINMWNIGSREYISLASTGDDWVMYTPDGYFDASPHGGELVAMVKGLEAFGVDQFAARNNRPDLILERMGLGTPELITYYNLLYQKRLKKLGLTEADFSSELHAPEAKITGTKQDGKFINVSFSFSDSKYPLKNYNIYVNDVPLFGSSWKKIGGKSFKGTEKIELTAGRNKIELSAMNNTGAESYRALTYADYDGKEKAALYYLAFGASKYKDAKLSLNYADKDVKDLEAVLSKMRPAYSDIHVKTFLNGEVTPENIKKAKDFLKDSQTDDTIILAIAGHGGYSKGNDPKYYYVAYETDVNKLASTGVDFEAIEDLLDDIKPRKKLFLMDTCESGELDENVYENYYTLADARGFKPRTYRKPMKARGSDNKKGRGYLYEKDRFIYNDLSRRTGAVVFSSSKGGEISYESAAIQNGFFTKEIINALTTKAADKNNDGKIDSGELRDFVSGAVSKGTGGLQHPAIDRDNLYQKIDLPLILN